MNDKTKTIAVLTSGGDAPGMNAAVRAVARAALTAGMNVLGVRRGYNGLISGDVFPMTLRTVSDIIQRGGTVLYTARSPLFHTQEGVEKAADRCRSLGIDGVVVIGGDGSFRGARDLSNFGINCVGIPGTIDNDIACSEYTIGFDTALNTAMQMIDRIRDTSQSHDRCNVVEVMGRNCGDLALQTGIACGAGAIILPEIETFDFDRDVLERIRLAQMSGKQHFIVLAAEGVFKKSKNEKPDGLLRSQGIRTAETLTKMIEDNTGLSSRCTVLGHVQRGGSPTVRDRFMASRMGYHAVELLQKGLGNRVVAFRGRDIVDYDITEALDMTKTFDKALYDMALAISI